MRTKHKKECLNSLALTLLRLLSWCALKEGFVPHEDSEPLKYYQHVVIVALIPFMLDCMAVILLITVIYMPVMCEIVDAV